MSKLKVTVIGTGHLGSIHSKLWSDNPNAELVGIFDTDEVTAEKISSEYSCSKFSSIEEAVNNSEIVTIAAPTSHHYEIADLCIDKGKHCFIEKPVTATYEEAKKLINKAAEKDIIIHVGHVERFNPAIAALKDYKLKPLFIEAHRLSQFRPRAIDVSVIHDLMIHDIDIILWLTGSKVSSIIANGVPVITETTDIANARITFENGSVANLTASRISANAMRKMRIFQQDAYFSIDFAGPKVDVYRIIDSDEERENATPAIMLGSIEAGVKNKNIFFEQPDIPRINAIAEEQDALINAVITGGKTVVGIEEAAEALRIAEEIARQLS